MEEIEYLEEYEDFIIPKNRTDSIPDDGRSVDSLELLYKDLIGESPSPTEESALLSQFTSNDSISTEKGPHLQAMTAGLLGTPLLISKPTSFTGSPSYMKSSNTAEAQQQMYNCQTSSISFIDRAANKNFSTSSTLQRNDKLKSVATVKPTLQRAANNPAKTNIRSTSPPLKSATFKQSHHLPSHSFGSDTKSKTTNQRVIKITNQFQSSGTDPLSLDDQDTFLDFDVDKPGFVDDLDFESDLDNSLIGGLSDMDSDSIDLSDDYSDNDFDFQSELSSEGSAYKRAVYKPSKPQDGTNATLLRGKAGTSSLKQDIRKGPVNTAKNKQPQNVKSALDQQYPSKMSELSKRQYYSSYAENKVQASFKKSQLIDNKNSSMGQYGAKSSQLTSSGQVSKLSQQSQGSLSKSLEKLSSAVSPSTAKKTAVAPVINSVVLKEPENELGKTNVPMALQHEKSENIKVVNIENPNNVNETVKQGPSLKTKECHNDETIKVATSSPQKPPPPQTITDVLKQKDLLTPDKNVALKLGSMYLKSIKPPVWKALMEKKDSPTCTPSPQKQLVPPKFTTTPEHQLEQSTVLVTSQVVLKTSESTNISNENISKEIVDEKSSFAASVDNNIDVSNVQLNAVEKVSSSDILSGTTEDKRVSKNTEENPIRDKSTDNLSPTPTFCSDNVDRLLSSETPDKIIKTKEIEVEEKSPDISVSIEQEPETVAHEDTLQNECTSKEQDVENLNVPEKMPSLVYNIKKRSFKIRVNRKTIAKFLEPSTNSPTCIKHDSPDSENRLTAVCDETMSDAAQFRMPTTAKRLESEPENKLKRKRVEASSEPERESKINSKRKSTDTSTDAQIAITPTIFASELEKIKRPKRKLIKTQIGFRDRNIHSYARFKRKTIGPSEGPPNILESSQSPDVDAATQTKLQSASSIKGLESKTENKDKRKTIDTSDSQSKISTTSKEIEAAQETKSMASPNNDQSKMTTPTKSTENVSEKEAKTKPVESAQTEAPNVSKISEHVLERRVTRKPVRTTAALQSNTPTVLNTPASEPRRKVKRKPIESPTGAQLVLSSPKTIESESDNKVEQPPLDTAIIAKAKNTESENKSVDSPISSHVTDPDAQTVLEPGTENEVKRKTIDIAAKISHVRSPNGQETIESESESRVKRKPTDTAAINVHRRKSNEPKTAEQESESRAKRKPTDTAAISVHTRTSMGPKTVETELENKVKRKPTDSPAMGAQRRTPSQKSLETELENKTKRKSFDSAARSIQTRTPSGSKTLETESENRFKRKPVDSIATTAQLKTPNDPVALESESKNKRKLIDTITDAQNITLNGSKAVLSESENIKGNIIDSASTEISKPTASREPKPKSGRRPTRQHVETTAAAQTKMHFSFKRLQSEPENRRKRRPVVSESGVHSAAKPNTLKTPKPEAEFKAKCKSNDSGNSKHTKTPSTAKEPCLVFISEKTLKRKLMDSASPASVNTTPLSGYDKSSKSQKLSSKTEELSEETDKLIDVPSSVLERPEQVMNDAEQSTCKRIKKGKRRKIYGSRKFMRSTRRASLKGVNATNNESMSQEISFDESRTTNVQERSISESQDISTEVNSHKDVAIHDQTNSESTRHEITHHESRTNVQEKANSESHIISMHINGQDESPATSSTNTNSEIGKGEKSEGRPVSSRNMRKKINALRKSTSNPSVSTKEKSNNAEKDHPPVQVQVDAPSEAKCSRNENPLPEIPPTTDSTIPAEVDIIQPKMEVVADTVIFHFQPDSTCRESINKLDGCNRTLKSYEQSRCSSNQFSSEPDNSESGNDATITVFELPSFIVMKTKIINRSDLPSNKAFNPPIIKQQVEEPAEEEQIIPTLKTERPEFKDICLEINSLLVRNANYLKFASGSERYNRMNQVLADASLSVEDAQCTLKFLQSYLALRSKEITVKSKGQQFIPIYDSQKKVIGYRKRTIHSKRSSSKMPVSGVIPSDSTNSFLLGQTTLLPSMPVHQTLLLPTKKEPQTLRTGEEEVIVPDAAPATGCCIKSEEDNAPTIAAQIN